jgi:hypothetical protein
MCDPHEGEEILQACKLEMMRFGINFREVDEKDVGYYGVITCMRALTGLAAALDRFGQSDEAEEWAGNVLRLAQRSNEELRVVGYWTILERYPRSSPARQQAEQEAVELLPMISNVNSRSYLAETLLETTRVSDLATARNISKYLIGESYLPSAAILTRLRLETFPAILQRQGLVTGASLILEAAATFSQEDLLYAGAVIAHQSAIQNGSIDDRLLSFLQETLAMFAL